MSILPQSKKEFYALFHHLAGLIYASSALFHELISDSLDPKQSKDTIAEIIAREKQADQTLKDIAELVSGKFVTPFSSQETLHLAELMDNILDQIENGADLIRDYDFGDIPPETGQMSALLAKGCQVLTEMIKPLSDFRHPFDMYAEIRELEHKADVINKAAIAKYYHATSNFEEFKRWFIIRELISTQEKAVDALRDVSNILRRIIEKHV
ncbi:MAG: DUF47 domain-containing protein [Candidatus Kerfeldbacteria bacterium]